jgi:hypothetical protein
MVACGGTGVLNLFKVHTDELMEINSERLA